MAETTDKNLRLDLPDVGLDDGTWGGILNILINELEQAITGTVAISLVSSDHTLNVVGDGTDRARRAILLCTGILADNVDIIAPAEPKIYIVSNKTTQAFTVGIKTAAGARINIPQNDRLLVFCDGLDFFQINALISGTVAKATDCDTLITIAGANFAQKAVKNQWTKPQVIDAVQVALTLNDPTRKTYTPNADNDTNILVKQSEMNRDSQDVEFKNPTGTPQDGQIMIFTVEQRDASPVSVVWGTKYKWPDNTAIDLTQTIDKIDAFSFMYNANVSFWLNFGTALNIPRA